jgi:4-amino-4-deoxy-L-arabinose transferase-like glycosyltransferase
LILEYSDWITLHYDSETPFLGKPPLAFWLSAIGIDWFGANAFGPRLPILSAAIIAVVLLYRFVAGNADREIAARSALVMSGSFFFFRQLRGCPDRFRARILLPLGDDRLLALRGQSK